MNWFKRVYEVISGFSSVNGNPLQIKPIFMSAVRFLEDVFTSSWTKVLSLDLNKRKTSLFYENSIWLFLIWDTRLLNVIARNFGPR